MEANILLTHEAGPGVGGGRTGGGQGLRVAATDD